MHASPAPNTVAITAVLHGWLYQPFDVSDGWKALLYAVTWIVLLAGLYVIFIWARKKPWYHKWETQDIFILAILAVLLLVWDSFLNDQLFGPLVTAIPVAGNFLNWIQLPTIPYMFIIMVAVASIRKPGVVTCLIFVKRFLGEIMFATHGLNVPNWPDALDEGVFTDLYIMARGDHLLSDMKAMLVDGLVIGFLRAGPNVIITCLVLDPFLNGTIHTWGTLLGTNIAGNGGLLGNGIGNAVQAAVVAPLAVQVARSIGVLGRRKPVRREPMPAAVHAMSDTGLDPGGGSGAVPVLGPADAGRTTEMPS